MSERDPIIDIGKGFGIIFVIMGHTRVTYHKLALFIDSFNMPFFFILSGMVINTNYSIFQFIKKKIKSLLINYYILNFILLIWKQIINNPQKCFRKQKFMFFFLNKFFGVHLLITIIIGLLCHYLLLKLYFLLFIRFLKMFLK